MDDKISQIINYYDPRELDILPVTIGSGGSATVYTANWKNTLTIHVIKRFRNDSMRDMKEIIINEV